MKKINVAKEFSPDLTSRDGYQRDGRFTGKEFRETYLRELDNPEAWKTDSLFIVFDFSDVNKLGPSWANEAFAYFTTYANPDLFFRKVHFENISRVKLMTIRMELEKGHSGR